MNLVIPRDFFNHAKVLKCYGQLALAIHNGVVNGSPVPDGLSILCEDDIDAFVIRQNPNTGGLWVLNVDIMYKGRLISLESPYNSKDSYPLRFENTLTGDEESVFDTQGGLAVEFLEYLHYLEGEED